MQQIGRYHLLGELGRGAMGIVYEAADPIIGRNIAIKTIHLQTLADVAEGDFLRDRLFREARSAGALSHPNIVIIFDVGDENDTAYIAMELVKGPTLQEILASGRDLPYAETISILLGTAAALDCAHANGIIHRDIKPGNIMLHNGETVKVTDFGIAKITDTMHHTQAGLMLGTPSYMSPEQMKGQAVGGKSDQFSLAVVAFEMLTRTKPFKSDSLPALVHMIVYEERPSPRSVNPDLPMAVDDVMKKALAASPEGRYDSCTQFVGALAAALKVRVEPAPEASLPFPPPSGVKERRWQELPPPKSAHASKSIRSRLQTPIVVALLVIIGVLLAKIFVPGSKVPPPPVAAKFTADPQIVPAGKSATLRWLVRGATDVVIDQGIGKVAADGTIEVTPLAPTIYTLTANGPNEKVLMTVSVNVIQKTQPPAATPPRPEPPRPPHRSSMLRRSPLFGWIRSWSGAANNSGSIGT